MTADVIIIKTYTAVTRKRRLRGGCLKFLGYLKGSLKMFNEAGKGIL